MNKSKTMFTKPEYFEEMHDSTDAELSEISGGIWFTIWGDVIKSEWKHHKDYGKGFKEGSHLA